MAWEGKKYELYDSQNFEEYMSELGECRAAHPLIFGCDLMLSIYNFFLFTIGTQVSVISCARSAIRSPRQYLCPRKMMSTHSTPNRHSKIQSSRSSWASHSTRRPSMDATWRAYALWRATHWRISKAATNHRPLFASSMSKNALSPWPLTMLCARANTRTSPRLAVDADWVHVYRIFDYRCLIRSSHYSILIFLSDNHNTASPFIAL